MIYRLAEFTARVCLAAAISFSFLTMTAESAWADCTSPAAPAGNIDYFNVSGQKVFKFCDGTNWVPWAGERVTGAAPVSSSAALGGSTMVTNWPDAIKCTRSSDNSPLILYADVMPFSDGKYYYRVQWADTSNYPGISFNGDGTFNALSLVTSADCNGKSISQLYASNQAFNFVGGSGSGASSSVWVDGGSGKIHYNGGNVGIGTTDPKTALHIGGTLKIGDGTELCNAADHEGALKYDAAGDKFYMCRKSATGWEELGTGSGGGGGSSGPSFYVHKNGTNQAISANTYSKLTWSTEVFDTDNNFSSNRFTPTKAGKYIINLTARCAGSNGECYAVIYKNGTGYAGSSDFSSSDGGPSLSTIVDMNGSTDYVEAYIWSTSSGSVLGSYSLTHFSGAMIGGASSGGSSAPGGADTQVQFNDGGSALGGDAKFIWNKTTSKLTVDGNIDFTGVMTDTSDARLKENIAPLESDVFTKVKALQPVSFTMKATPDAAPEFGFLAQDVRPLFPNLVAEAADEAKTLSLNYQGMIALLVQSIKDMDAENTRQREEFAAELKALRAEIDNLKQGGAE